MNLKPWRLVTYLEKAPWWTGYGWDIFQRRCAVWILMPFNWPARWVRAVYWSLRIPRRQLFRDKILLEADSIKHTEYMRGRASIEMANQKDLKEAFRAGYDHAFQVIENNLNEPTRSTHGQKEH